MSAHLYNISDIDTTLTATWKLLDTPDWLTRRAVVELAASLLLATQVEQEGVRDDMPVKTRKGALGQEGQSSGMMDSVDASRGRPTDKASLQSTSEMLRHITLLYNRPGTSARARNVLVDVYATLLYRLGRTYVEGAFSAIFDNICLELGTGAQSKTSRHETLLARHYARLLLDKVIAGRLLKEEGQRSAVEEIVKRYLGKFPAAIPGTQEPATESIVLALQTMADLLGRFGASNRSLSDTIPDCLLHLLRHGAPAVRIYASCALARFCVVNPLRLRTLLEQTQEILSAALSSVQDEPDAKQLACLEGSAAALSALVAASASLPLYTSARIPDAVMQMALQMLKRTAHRDLFISASIARAAWGLIGACLQQGFQVVQAHLPQLLLLWKNSLPKYTSSTEPDNAQQPDSAGEWAFILTVREGSLGALWIALKSHPSLLSLDATRRLTIQLTAALSSPVPQKHLLHSSLPVGFEPLFSSSSRLLDLLAAYHSRLLTCIYTVESSNFPESFHFDVCRFALRTFAEADLYIDHSAQTAINAAHSSATSAWELADGWGCGIGPPAETRYHGSDPFSPTLGDLDVQTILELDLEVLLRRPSLEALEYDPLRVLQVQERESRNPASALVDNSILLFGRHFAMLEPVPQLDLARQVSTFKAAVESSDRHVWQKASLRYNIATALLSGLKAICEQKSVISDALLDLLSGAFRVSGTHHTRDVDLR